MGIQQKPIILHVAGYATCKIIVFTAMTIKNAVFWDVMLV
jgi:hypothetical protein